MAQACYNAALTAVAYFDDEITVALTDPEYRRHALGSASEAGNSVATGTRDNIGCLSLGISGSGDRAD